MKRLKRRVCVALVVILILTVTCTPVSAAYFTDVT